jgi:hypothetical protein
VVGYGFGASYLPDSSFVAANVGPDGRVHSIHVGPALVFFRFGLFGLGLCAGALLLTLLVMRDLRRQSWSATWISRDLVAVCAVALLLFSVECLMLNATVQPAMSWCLAIILGARLSARSAAPVSGAHPVARARAPGARTSRGLPHSSR